MKKVIIGNWKMNKDKEEVLNFIDIFNKSIDINKIRKDLTFGIAAPFVYLPILEILNGNVVICAQNVSEHEFGAFTGEISASMLESLGTKMVILGHSERRIYFNETNEIVNKKAIMALKHNITPIICVGETEEQYSKGLTKEIIKNQIENSLINIKDYSKIIVAYEPIWAIGTGKTATPKIAQDVCAYIRSLTSKDLMIQYGGSVSKSNINEILNQHDIDGALVGGASLDPHSFLDLLIN